MRPRVEIVIPVYNEEQTLAASVIELNTHLSSALLECRVQLTIADNASTDGTAAIAGQLVRELPGVTYLRLPEKGRGRALRAAWGASQADVVAYMDVDLSTDLQALEPLLEPLLDGTADIAVGNRLAPDSEVDRSFKREFISRSYNRLLRMSLYAGFTDAQCGFKAARREPLQALLPMIENQTWFFDTELLYLAQRNGLRIHQVPVRWVEDRDSSVRIVHTAIENLKGIARLRRRAIRGADRVGDEPLSPHVTVL